MAMMENQGKEVQTCLLTHTVRSEMQMAELATTPPPPGFRLPGLLPESRKCTTVQALASLAQKFNFL